MDRTDKRVVLMLAECNLNATQCARRLYMHRNTIVYHINRVYKKTNLNPLKFYDMCKLLDKIHQETPTGQSDDANSFGDRNDR